MNGTAASNVVLMRSLPESANPKETRDPLPAFTQAGDAPGRNAEQFSGGSARRDANFFGPFCNDATGYSFEE